MRLYTKRLILKKIPEKYIFSIFTAYRSRMMEVIMFRAYTLIFAISLTLILTATGICQELQLVAGAGPSTKISTLFFTNFQAMPEASGYSFEVPPRSIKHAGGIQASDTYLFGRTGRPLNKKEKALGKGEIFLASIPLSFVAGSDTGVKSLTRLQLRDILSGKIVTWKEVGGADHDIVLIGREKTEAALSVLRNEFPSLDEAKYARVFKRDHQVVNYIKSEQGRYALGFGAKSNFDPEYHIFIEDFSQGINVGLVYDLKNGEHPLITAVKKYAGSTSWHTEVLNSGFLIAVDPETVKKE